MTWGCYSELSWAELRRQQQLLGSGGEKERSLLLMLLVLVLLFQLWLPFLISTKSSWNYLESKKEEDYSTHTAVVLYFFPLCHFVPLNCCCYYCLLSTSQPNTVIAVITWSYTAPTPTEEVKKKDIRVIFEILTASYFLLSLTFSLILAHCVYLSRWLSSARPLFAVVTIRCWDKSFGIWRRTEHHLCCTFLSGKENTAYKKIDIK